MKITAILWTKRKLDFVVLGATGFTGRYVVEQISRTLGKDKSGLVWGIAGRNRAKLSEVLPSVGVCGQSKSDSQIAVIEVDINDRNSLLSMCRESRLVVNCCGPYRLLGEQVVSACIATGCHHMDVSGEPEFLETIQHKYHKQAMDSKVSVIGSCGFDSVPADLGVQFLKAQFEGTLNSVETYLRVSTTAEQAVSYNFATWHSLVFGYANRQHLTQLRQQLHSTFRSYRWKHRIKRHTLSTNRFGYCVPFPGSDRSVVSRTQLFKYTDCEERPTQIETYFTVNSLGALLALVFVNTAVSLLAPHPYGQQLLMKYPNVFSFGVFNRRTQPKREALLKNSFELWLIGKGWNDKFIDVNFQPSKAPDKTMTARISGGDLAYLDTSMIVTQIILTILELLRQQRLPSGVLTPGVAFADTPLIDRLNQNGIRFEIIAQK